MKLNGNTFIKHARIIINIVCIIGWIVVAMGFKVTSDLRNDISVINTTTSTLVNNLETEIASIKDENELLKKRLNEDLSLGKFVIELMTEVRAKLSPMRKQIVAQTVVRVANNIFKERDHKYHFAVLLAMESKFNNNAKSKVDATGIAQIMPKYAKEFANICGIHDYTKNDLKDLELNMTIGACQFNALLHNKTINGNVAAALVAYNAGINSVSFRSLVGLKNIENLEPANYVARFTFLSSEIKNLVKETEDEKKKE